MLLLIAEVLLSLPVAVILEITELTDLFFADFIFINCFEIRINNPPINKAPNTKTINPISFSKNYEILPNGHEQKRIISL